jgi:predicted phosphohydrolase
MTRPFRIALTADLHWGHRTGGDATRLLATYLSENPPDLLILAGDIGTGPLFPDCLRLFADLPCRKALVPGNHDVWVSPDGQGADSLEKYERLLPAAAQEYSFHYLDQGPLLFPEVGLAVVGSMNWYDYSWALAGLRRNFPEEEGRLQSKRFTRGRHNDFNFIRWPFDDIGITQRVAAKLEVDLVDALAQVPKVIVVTHHPPYYDLSFPHPGPPVMLDQFLWDAFAGNSTVQNLMTKYADRIAYAFCGHTHRALQADLAGIHGFNIGGDYHFKRLLFLDWSSGSVAAHEFNDR